MGDFIPPLLYSTEQGGYVMFHLATPPATNKNRHCGERIATPRISLQFMAMRDVANNKLRG